MSSFISLFKKEYSKNEKNVDEITNESIHNKLISLLEDNSTDDIDANDLNAVESFEKNIKLVANGLITQSLSEIEEKSKEKLLKTLLDGKGTKINKLANKYKMNIDKKIIDLRKKIVSLIKNKPNINSIINGEEDVFDENSFYGYLSQGKKLIFDFLTKYRIKKRFSLDLQVFDDILKNYQSFNLACLSNLYNYLEKFENYYQIYMNFATIIKSINKINNIINNMKNVELDTKYIDNVYQGLEEGSFNIYSLFDKLNKEIKKISGQVEINSKEIEKLKIDNAQLNNRVDVLEIGLKTMREELQYPNSSRIMESPIITPYGSTNEEKEIKDWIQKQGNDPLIGKPIEENHLIKNYGLKNVIGKDNDMIEKYQKIKNKK